MSLRYTSSFDQTTGWCDLDIQLHLTANNEQSYTIPGDSKDKYKAVFYYISDSNIFVAYDDTATVPAADATTTTKRLVLRPETKWVTGGHTLSFITPDTAQYVSVEFFSVPNH